MQDIVQKWIKKLELNENTVSTAIGGLVLVVVGFLFVSYFGERSEKAADTPTDGVISEGVEGDVSSTAVSRYVVKEGDTLWRIAEANYSDGHMWTQIAQANGIDNPDLIEKGSELDIPRLDVVETVAGVSTQIPDSYEVVQGDYLWKIAENIYGDGLRWSEIYQENRDKITNPELVEVGVVLSIPQ